MIESIRFRSEGELIVLQVGARPEKSAYYNQEDTLTWRDAKVEDLLHVAQYTRAYDALDKTLASLQSGLTQAQNHMMAINDRSIKDQVAQFESVNDHLNGMRR